MSPDNWATCPQCQDRKNRSVQAETDEIAAQYGKVSQAEWAVLSKRGRNLTAVIEETLREGFYSGVDENGLLEIAYSCSCDVCGWEYKYPSIKQCVYEPEHQQAQTEDA